MSKKEFLDRLCAGLRTIPDPDEIQSMVSFYDQAIDDRIEDGMTEEEAVGAMGDLEEIIASARQSDRQEPKDKSRASFEEPGGERDLDWGREEVSRIDIYDTSGEISLAPSRDGRLHVCYSATKNWRYKIEGSGTLKIVRSKNSQDEQLDMELFGHKFSIPKPNLDGLFENDLQLRILIPEGWSGSVLVNTASGGFTARGVGLGELTARMANGDIDISGLRLTGKLSLITASGDVSGNDLVSGEMNISTASGDVELNCVSCGGVSINTASGDVGIVKAAPERLTVHSASGDIDASLSGVCRSVSMEAVSGDIRLNLPGHRDLYSVSVKASSGDVDIPDGSGLGPNIVRLKAFSGDVSVRYSIEI